MTRTNLFQRALIVLIISLITLGLFIVGNSTMGIITAKAESETENSIQTTSFTEASDVYWLVHNGTLILSNEQGNSGLEKWSKDSIASVNNASSVPWNSSRASITEVRYYGPIAPSSIAYWFQDTAITEFDVSVDGTLYLDLKFTTNAMRAFSGCDQLTALDLSSTSAPNVTDIESAFDSCTKLVSLDISCFNGAPITNMINAFYDCKALKSLDVSGLDTSRVNDFTSVFEKCESLTSLDLTNIDGRNLESLDSTFRGCKKLKSISFGANFTAEKVTSMKNTFYGCEALTSLDISGFSTSKVTDMSGTFNACKALAEIKFGAGFNCNAVTSMEKIFLNCFALTSIDTSGWNAKNVKNLSYAFASCGLIETIDLSGFDGAQPTEIKGMFEAMTSLKSIDLREMDFSLVKDFGSLFNGCSALESFDFSSIDTSSAIDMSSMFNGCSSLKEIDFTGVDTSSVTTMESMFYNCKKLDSVNLSGVNTAKLTDASSMFYGCSSITKLDMSDFDVTEGLDTKWIFRLASRLAQITLPKTIPNSISIGLDYTFYTGTEEITEFTQANEGKTVVRKFDIVYYWKNGNTSTPYTLEPNYYYYGVGTTIDAVISKDGYEFEGWTRKDSDEIVTAITDEDVGDVYLYAKMTPFKVVVPAVYLSNNVTVTYGEGVNVSANFVESELHTYRIEWYRTPSSVNSGGVEVSGLRNQKELRIEPFSFDYGVTIGTKTYFYCVVTATRTDNGLTSVARSSPVMVLINKAQADIAVHPTAIEGLVYTGSAQAVTEGGTTNYEGRLSIVYGFGPNPSFYGHSKTTNAGEGIVYYKTASSSYFIDSPVYSLTYKIERATPTIEWSESSVEVDYTGSAISVKPPVVTLLNGETYGGTIEYSYTGTFSGNGLPTNAGEYEITASIQEEGNYKGAVTSTTLKVIINKVVPTFISHPTAIDGLTYNANDIVLVNAGEVSGGIVEYSLDNSTWSSSLPVGKNAGEYTVYYRIAGDTNYIDGDGGSLVVSIARKDITITANDLQTCVLVEPQLSYSVSGLCEGDALNVTPTLIVDDDTSVVGTYTIGISGAGVDGNYNISYVSGTLVVNEHKYDNACDGDCNECGEERTPEKHVDVDKNNVCDECEANLEVEGLPVGAIVGIIVGSVVVIGVGGFAIFWFVIKKKKWSDLFHK